MINSSKNLTPLKILVVEDDRRFKISFTQFLSSRFEKVSSVETRQEAQDIFLREHFDVVLLDFYLPDGSSVSLIPEFRSKNPTVCIIIITKEANYESKSLALELGAADYIVKPIVLSSIDRISEDEFFTDCIIRIEKSRRMIISDLSMIQKHKALKAHLESYQDQLIGISSSMSSVRSQVENCRSTSFNVLISGESGTGKKLVSKNIIQHHLEQELAVLDCRSSTTEEHEVILFGYAAGSFTGADSSTDGLMSKANNGILAIYEIDNLSLTAQTKLLKAIESGEYYPLGSSIPIKSSCRIISTTNKNLQQLANNGLFNASLLQLLNTFQINLEPLRERLEDIPSLSQSILLKVAGIKYYLRSETIDYLKTLSWKRNVMELKIFLDYAYIQAIANDRFDIRIHDFYSKLWKQPKTNLPTSKAQVCKKHYSKAINSTEKRYLKTALRLFENNIPQLSNALEISKPTIYTRLKIHQLFHKT